MKTWLENLKNDPVYLLGLVLAGFSLLMFGLLPMGGADFEIFSAKFLCAYLSLIAYFIVVLSNNRDVTGKRFKFYSLPHNIALLLLGNISAYALNESVALFHQSVTWLSVFLVVLNLLLVVIGTARSWAPSPWNYMAVAVLAVGTVLQLYQTIYVFPVMFVGLLAFWFFGISLHAWLPFWSLMLMLRVLQKFYSASKSYRYAAIAGWTIPTLLLISFVLKWNLVCQSITQAYREDIAPIETSGLPTWVKAGQRIDEDWITKRILQCESVGASNLFNRPGVVSENGILHDPFVVSAYWLTPSSNFSGEVQRTLSEAMAASRHVTEPRLWSGDALRTKDIITNVQLFPEYRLSYTEKTITIENTGENDARQQEAIFSFYLPEGAVVSSASLWIGGKEEAAYLTTKSKAENAYNTIVGRERRDPLLVTWREGNRVTARIFPCTPAEQRQFKIGFTSPMRLDETSLVYENIDFDGPEKGGAVETIRILQEGSDLEIDADFNLDHRGKYLEATGSYRPDWSAKMEAPTLRNDAFSFNGRSVQLVPLPDILEPFACKAFYLDLNDSWSRKEFDQVFEAAGDRPVYVFDNGLVQVTEKNRGQLFQESQELNFSIFPFHKILDPEQAVVISKSSGSAPLPQDLEESQFSVDMGKTLLALQSPIRLINLDDELSPFVAALKEARCLQVQATSLSTALLWVENQQFPANQEDADNIVIARAGMKIRQTTSAVPSGRAPDHLLRLFAYNDMMKSIGQHYFSKDWLEESLLAQAQESNIVSPVSSLITLESQEDYDRFEIEKPAGKSLKNASIHSSGAVPEPHEWLLLFFAVCLAVFLFYRR